MPPAEALELLDYHHDRALLAAFDSVTSDDARRSSAFRIRPAADPPLRRRRRARGWLRAAKRRRFELACEPPLRMLEQCSARALRPVLGIDVDRVQLTDAALVAARPDGREAHDVPVVALDDERRPAGRRLDEPPRQRVSSTDSASSCSGGNTWR